MFDNKMLEVQSTQEMLFPVYVCVCACVPAWRALKLTSKVGYTLSFGRAQTMKYTQNM